jgi:hypothetical protein
MFAIVCCGFLYNLTGEIIPEDQKNILLPGALVAAKQKLI